MRKREKDKFRNSLLQLRKEITREIQQAFQAAIRGRHPRSAEWLDYVNTAVDDVIQVKDTNTPASRYTD